jgi:hypothetical protein
MNTSIIPSLLSVLLAHGQHPVLLIAANGIVLPKSAKPSYNDLSAFHIFVLLETISKILEWIVTFRLYDHTITNKLNHPNHNGSLPSRSVNDAILNHFQEVKTLQAEAYKVSTLFLDIKGGFDNVQAQILAQGLKEHNTPRI